MEDAIKDGVDGSNLPHVEDGVDDVAHVVVLTLEVHQVAQVEAANRLVVLVQLQRRHLLHSPPLRHTQHKQPF